MIDLAGGYVNSPHRNGPRHKWNFFGGSQLVVASVLHLRARNVRTGPFDPELNLRWIAHDATQRRLARTDAVRAARTPGERGVRSPSRPPHIGRSRAYIDLYVLVTST